jgi:pyruvate dehydrogenase E1 component alpha subunit
MAPRHGRIGPQAVSLGQVKPVQLLSPAGEFTSHQEFPVDLTPNLCRGLFRRMSLARRLDAEALALQRQGELGLWLQCWGQEAAQVGSMTAIRADDWVFPSYRDHAAAMCRGIAPAELLSQWRGCTASGWDPYRYRFQVYTLVLAAQLPHATGFAMGVTRDGANEVVLAYFGDGASSEGDASESFNWAAAVGAPVIFFCQNNQWAISTPAATQTHSPLYQRGAGFGLASYLVDGNDVLAVHAVTKLAAARVRSGGSPALIEARTYRMAGHSTSDDPRRYRPAAELDHWRSLDPIDRLRRLLDDRRWAGASFYAQLTADADDLAAEVRRDCLALQPPPLTDLFGQVLAGDSALLASERDEYLAFASSFAD